MKHVDTVTARGHGKWGYDVYDVALRTRVTTQWDRSGERREIHDEYYVDFPATIGSRQFADAAARDAFLAASFTDLSLSDVGRPVAEEAPSWVAPLVGATMEAVTFVADYLQIQWSSGGMNAYRMPLLELPTGETVEPSDPLYAGRFVGLLNEVVEDADVYLDAGLIISMPKARLVISFEPDGYEILEFPGVIIS